MPLYYFLRFTVLAIGRPSSVTQEIVLLLLYHTAENPNLSAYCDGAVRVRSNEDAAWQTWREEDHAVCRQLALPCWSTMSSVWYLILTSDETSVSPTICCLRCRCHRTSARRQFLGWDLIDNKLPYQHSPSAYIAYKNPCTNSRAEQALLTVWGNPRGISRWHRFRSYRDDIQTDRQTNTQTDTTENNATLAARVLGLTSTMECNSGQWKL